MAKTKINLKNPEHQYIIVSLTLMYYSCGDVKDVYEDEQLCRTIAGEFGIKTDKAMAGFLDSDELSKYYRNPDYLRVVKDPLPDSKYQD